MIQDLIVSLMSTSPSFKDPYLGKKDYVMWPIPPSPYPFFSPFIFFSIQQQSLFHDLLISFI